MEIQRPKTNRKKERKEERKKEKGRERDEEYQRSIGEGERE